MLLLCLQPCVSLRLLLLQPLLPLELCLLCAFSSAGPGAKVGRLAGSVDLLLLWRPETHAEVAGCQLHPRSCYHPNQGWRTCCAASARVLLVGYVPIHVPVAAFTAASF